MANKVKSAAIREMDHQVLIDAIESKREELFKLRVAWALNRLENAYEIQVARKDIARMMTILHERELAAHYVTQAGGEGNA